MENRELQSFLARFAIRIGLEIRKAVNEANPFDRAKKERSILKPNEFSRYADVIGEQIGVKMLKEL